MSKLLFSREQPKEPGYYIARFSFWYDLIRIYDGQVYERYSHEKLGVQLCNANGGSTHFSRWDCEWSQKIELPELAINAIAPPVYR